MNGLTRFSLSDDVLSKVYASFDERQRITLATAEGDQPRLRPVTLIHLGGRFYVVTGSGDAKVVQIKQNPKVEFCLLREEGGNTGYVRGECTAKIVADKAVKAELYDKLEYMRQLWESPDDPTLVLIELKPAVFEYMEPGDFHATKVKAR